MSAPDGGPAVSDGLLTNVDELGEPASPVVVRPRLGPIGKRKQVPIRVSGEDLRHAAKVKTLLHPGERSQAVERVTKYRKRKTGENPSSLDAIPEDRPLESHLLQFRRLSIGKMASGPSSFPTSRSLSAMLESVHRNPSSKAAMQLLNTIDDVVIVPQPRLQRYTEIKIGDLDSIVVDVESDHEDHGCSTWFRHLMSCFNRNQSSSLMRDIIPYREGAHHRLLDNEGQ